MVLKKIIKNQAKFNKNTKYCLDNISWESQMLVFKKIMETKTVRGLY